MTREDTHMPCTDKQRRYLFANKSEAEAKRICGYDEDWEKSHKSRKKKKPAHRKDGK